MGRGGLCPPPPLPLVSLMQSCFSRRIRGFIRYYPLAYPPDPHPGTFPAWAELTGQALPRWYDFGVWGWGCSPCHPSVSFGFPPPPPHGFRARGLGLVVLPTPLPVAWAGGAPAAWAHLP